MSLPLLGPPLSVSAAGATWTQQSPATSPPARYSAAMAYDSASSSVVLFGGFNTISRLADTWTWDGTTWTQQTPATSPPARYSASMAYDSASGSVVLFGGTGVAGLLGDTWTWDGATWTQHTPATSPPARYSASMAYDSASGSVVLFGGSGSGGALADTWTWDGTTWTLQTPATSPSARYSASMAYDSASSSVVLFGGSGSGGALGDTWTWNGTTWTQQTPTTNPPARSAATMAYHGASRSVVLFGGLGSSSTAIGDTWTWDGTTWTQQTTTPRPSARLWASMAYDSASGSVVLFGGFNGSNLDDTWTWNVAATTATTMASSSNPSSVGQNVTYTATVSPTPDGGTVAFTDNGSPLTGCGAVTVNTSTGTAPCTTSYNAVGSHSIVASYSGDSNYAASSGSLTQQVTTTVQESSPAVSFDSWMGVIDTGASGGTYRSSATKAATASFPFSGTGVTWITRRGPDRGIASVTIDGVSKGSFDLYAATAKDKVSEGFSGLTSAAHKIIIKVTGTKNAASTGTGVAVDAFVVGSTRTQDSSRKVSYDTWSGASSGSASGGAYRVSGKANATSGLSFSGTSVQWITATGPAYGEAEVIIDAVNQGTVDLYSSSVNWQIAETYSGLSSGPHTIVVKVLGIKNASSTGTKVVIDAFVVS
jgi:hypothetical protein